LNLQLANIGKLFAVGATFYRDCLAGMTKVRGLNVAEHAADKSSVPGRNSKQQPHTKPHSIDKYVVDTQHEV